jgi:hypothetical protein
MGGLGLYLCGSGYRLTLRVTEAALWIPQHQKYIISCCKSGHRPDGPTHDIVCMIQQEDKRRRKGKGVEKQQLVIVPSLIIIRPL